MKILIPDKVNENATKILEKEGFSVVNKPGITAEELISVCSDCDAMIVRSGIKITKIILEAAKKLKLIVRAGVGVDSIDLDSARELGIAVENTPTANINAAAEHTITLLLMLSKHIIHSHVELKGGTWDRKKYKGTELKGKTLGIVGLGNVGKKVSLVASALEMDVLGFDPFIDKEAMKEIGATKVELDELIKNSDYITVHVPLNDKTRDLISDKEFSEMKDDVKIINVARGGVVSEKALEKAIESGKVGAAALDVYTQEPPICHSLIAHDKVICTPHLGASTVEAQLNVGSDAAEQIIEALKNGKLMNVVNKVGKLREC
ncbi:MAG: hydroxyacid dehydrogenase [Nanoarchaeota archaeon]